MSSDDLELALRAIRAVTARPKPDWETVNELYSPDHVFVPVMPERVEARGARGYQELVRNEMQSGFGEGEAPVAWEFSLEGAIDVGRHTVLAVGTNTFRGAMSGAELKQRMWSVVTIRDRQVVRSEVFTDPEEALAAALGERP